MQNSDLRSYAPNGATKHDDDDDDKNSNLLFSRRDLLWVQLVHKQSN